LIYFIVFANVRRIMKNREKDGEKESFNRQAQIRNTTANKQ